MRTFVPRRRTLLAGVAACALAFAGVAAAGGMFGGGSSSLVSATFAATTLSHSHTSTCTARNGDQITKTDAQFTGTATSTDPHLNGPATFHVRSVFDSKTGAGSLVGDVKIDTSAANPPVGKFRAGLAAVNVNGAVQGFLAGSSGGGTSFLGGFSASFSTAGGFTNGAIGAGTPVNAAILISGGCSDHPVPPTTTSSTTTTNAGPIKDDDHGHHDGHHHH